MLTCFSGQHAVRGWANQAVHLALRAQHREAARLDQLLHNRYIRITYPTTLMPRQNCLVVSAWKSNFQVLKPPSPFLSLFLWYQAETHFGANSQKKICKYLHLQASYGSSINVYATSISLASNMSSPGCSSHFGSLLYQWRATTTTTKVGSWLYWLLAFYLKSLSHESYIRQIIKSHIRLIVKITLKILHEDSNKL